MNSVSIHYQQLPWLSADLQCTLQMFDRYHDPWTGVVEHEIRSGDLSVMHTRYPELAGHRRRYPIDTTARGRMITIPTGVSAPVIFARSSR
jgi:hypothetical protein